MDSGSSFKGIMRVISYFTGGNGLTSVNHQPSEILTGTERKTDAGRGTYTVIQYTLFHYMFKINPGGVKYGISKQSSFKGWRGQNARMCKCIRVCWA